MRVKAAGCVRLTTYHHPVPLSRNLGTLTTWNPLGLSRPVTVTAFTATGTSNIYIRIVFKDVFSTGHCSQNNAYIVDSSGSVDVIKTE